jgi:hypothetical protein
MAQWNLEVAAEIANLISQRWTGQWRALSHRLGVESEEPRRWQHVARDLYTGFDEQTAQRASMPTAWLVILKISPADQCGHAVPEEIYPASPHPAA